MGVPHVGNRISCKGMTGLTFFYLVILTSHPTSAESFHESDSLRGLQSYEDHGDNALRE